MVLGIQLCVLLVHLSGILSHIRFCKLYPAEVEQCFAEANNHPVNVQFAQDACITLFYQNQTANNVLTPEDEEFFALRSRTGYGLGPPPTGFRMRKEIRTLTDEERERLFNALETLYRAQLYLYGLRIRAEMRVFTYRVETNLRYGWSSRASADDVDYWACKNTLYTRGIIARFGRLHATAVPSIHRGAAFLPWHRTFLADFEEELRRVDPTVSLPYWDYTMDYDIARPSDSVVWSPCFFGNGFGTITSGRFAGWYGGRNGPIQRNYARPGPPECTSKLVSRRDIATVMSHCLFVNVSTGHRDNGVPYDVRNNIESLHDGPHDWVGGDMGELEWSSFDPVFWFHHCFTDFIWEMFRRKQVQDCGVNPEIDYRLESDSSQRGQPGHGINDRMRGYWHLRNMEGLRHSWTTDYYNYEPQPTCPACGGSPYLYCERDVDQTVYPNGVCLTRKRPACSMEHRQRQPFDTVGFGAFSAEDVVFVGEELSTYIQVPEVNRFIGQHGDGRNRDTSIEESRAIHMRESRGFMSTGTPRRAFAPPSSPVVQLFAPPIAGGFGGPPPTWGLGGISMLPGGVGSIARGAFDRVSFSGFIPGGYGKRKRKDQRFNCYGNHGFPFNPGFVPFDYGRPCPVSYYKTNVKLMHL